MVKKDQNMANFRFFYVKFSFVAIQITYPKRKRRGSVSYTHPTDAELDEAAKTIWWSSDVRKSVGSKSGKLLISKTVRIKADAGSLMLNSWLRPAGVNEPVKSCFQGLSDDRKSFQK